MKKKLNVVMLATNEKANIFDVFGKLEFHYGKPNGTYKHLYFLSDDKIKDMDVVTDGKVVWMIQIQPNTDLTKFKKVVISTDKLWEKQLPQPTKKFIELFISEYNKGNIITEVEIEYKCTSSYADIEILNRPFEYELKVNSDNTVNCNLIKNTWTREEVKLELKTMHINLYGADSYAMQQVENWIEENL